MTGAAENKARAVTERILDATGKAMLAGDFETFRSYFLLPHFISTLDRKITLETEDEMHATFLKVREDYLRKQVTELIRYCDVAEFRGNDRIEAMHTTHLMSGNRRVVEPYPSFAVMKRVSGVWRVSSSQYALEKTTSVGRALHIQSQPTSTNS